MDLQVVTGIVKRNASTFKSQIIEGSQCNATYKKAFTGLGSKPKSLEGFLAPVKEESDNAAKYLTKVLLFEDVDTVFVDETDFYSQLTKLLVLTKVPILMTASNYQYIYKHLLPILARSKDPIAYEVVNYTSRRP